MGIQRCSLLMLGAFACVSCPGPTSDQPTDRAQAPAEALRCEELTQLNNEQLQLSSSIVAATGDAPAHCRVVGTLEGSIGFAVTLPDRSVWKRRLLMTGTGGFAGFIGDTTSQLDRGFAMASTDTGHQTDSADFALDPQALLNYAHRAVHLVAETSKAIIEAHYGEPARYSYFSGCSNGGRQAMLEAQRYPEDLGGIVAGAPSFRMGSGNHWLAWTQQAIEANPLSREKLNLTGAASRAACDGLDGIEDGVIDDPRECTDDLFTPADLVCTEGQDTPPLALPKARLRLWPRSTRGL